MCGRGVLSGVVTVRVCGNVCCVAGVIEYSVLPLECWSICMFV